MNTVAHKRGAALVTTTLLGVVVASLVLVLVTSSMLDVRTGFITMETQAASDLAQDTINAYAANLGENPSYPLDFVHPRERARICVDGTVIQPGNPWPARCGSVWQYTSPQPPWGPFLATDVYLEVTFPNPYTPTLEVVALGRSGFTVSGWRTRWLQDAASEWTLAADGDMNLSEVVTSGGLNRGSVWAGGVLDVGNVSIVESLLAAGREVRGVSDEDREAGVTSVQGADALEVAPPLQSAGALANAMTQDGRRACAGGEPTNTTVPGPRLKPWPLELAGPEVTLVDRLCLQRGREIKLTDGTVRRVDVRTEAYMVVLRGNFVDIYTTQQPIAPKGGEVQNAAALAQGGDHPGVRGFWQLVGTSHLPATGIIAADSDIQVGLCGPGFASGVCERGGANASLTILAGNATKAADIWVGGTLEGAGGLTLAAWGEVVFPWWAAGNETLKVKSHVVALGRGLFAGGDSASSAIRSYPTGEASKNMEVTGSLTSPSLQFGDMIYNVAVVPDAQGVRRPPPGTPKFSQSWKLLESQKAAPESICGTQQACGSWF